MGDSLWLSTRTVAATTTNEKFQMMSSTTTGFEYAQSLCRSSSCSAAVSRTIIEGSRIARLPVPPLACRRNRAAWRRLCRCTNRRLGLASSLDPLELLSNGAVSTMSEEAIRETGLGDFQVFGTLTRRVESFSPCENQRVLIIKMKANEGLIVRIGREVRNCGFEVCATMEGTTK